MAESEFIDTVEKALKDNGVLEHLACQVRVEILQVLKSSLKVTQEKKVIAETTNNFLINELIKEYLEFNGYKHSADILSVESGQPSKRVERNDLENALKIHTGPNAKQVPLLYSMVTSFRTKNE